MQTTAVFRGVHYFLYNKHLIVYSIVSSKLRFWTLISRCQLFSCTIVTVKFLTLHFGSVSSMLCTLTHLGDAVEYASACLMCLHSHTTVTTVKQYRLTVIEFILCSQLLLCFTGNLKFSQAADLKEAGWSYNSCVSPALTML